MTGHRGLRCTRLLKEIVSVMLWEQEAACMSNIRSGAYSFSFMVESAVNMTPGYFKVLIRLAGAYPGFWILRGGADKYHHEQLKCVAKKGLIVHCSQGHAT